MRSGSAAILVFLFAGVLGAQQPSSTSRPAGPSTSGGSPSPANTNPSTSPFPDTNGPGQRPIFISGRVALSDGTPLPDRAKIERVCNGTPKIEGYTDRKGRFSIEIGHSLEMPDATSSSGLPDGLAGVGSRSQSGQGRGMDRSLWGCELRASLAAYRSDVYPLSTLQYMDNPDIGTLILHSYAKVDGLTISVTSALAPKDARKSYEKAHEALLKKNPDEAQKDLEKAVEIYPKYSSAWHELGALNEQRDHFEEARKDYQQAIAAEPKLLAPYVRLSWLLLRDSKWQELSDETEQWLKLDPSNSSDVYYLSGVANLQLQHFEVAEKNAREAIKLDSAGKNPRARYVLGLALAQQRKFVDSAESLRAFLAASPDVKDADVVRQQLAQVEAAAKQPPEAPAQQ